MNMFVFRVELLVFSEYCSKMLCLGLLVSLLIYATSSQQLPYYGNLHPLNFGESHCGPDISLYHGSAARRPNDYERFRLRNMLNKHLIYRDSSIFNRKRWSTGYFGVTGLLYLLITMN